MNYKILEFKDAKEAIKIREKVFVEEQGFENEFDDLDYQSLHLELYDNGPVGCARMYTLDNKVYILGRIAVLKEFRGLNYGSMLVSILEEKAKELKAEKIELSAQVRASAFYEKLGYQKYGEEYLDEYCPHIKMIKLFNKKDINKYRGCLVGGAIGDALGYAIEFDKEDYIFSYYGKEGISKYELYQGKALFSDDTQMTLFTAVGLLMGGKNSDEHVSNINKSYDDWLHTQLPKKHRKATGYSELYAVKELHHSRAPGGTCLNSLMSGGNGTIENPINDSKGCGGVMRVTPIGLYIDDVKDADMLGAKAAALTHGHELGYISSAMLVHMINRLNHGVELMDSIEDGIKTMQSLFKGAVHLNELIDLIILAVDLSKKDLNDIDAIHLLGEGWVAEETLAIAIYCSLKYHDDFDKAMRVSVNHRGDSDSTGAVTGNILGTYLGYDRIPEKYIKNLELKDLIIEIADRLYEDA